jgi:subtilisin family serine protease
MFEQYLAKVGPTENADAIVVYRAPADTPVRVRGRMRALKARLDQIKENAARLKPVQNRLFQSYQNVSEKTGTPKAKRTFSTIGRNTLPVAWVEVTPESIQKLAADPDVVAILPNLEIRLLQPRKVDYGTLGKRENKEGLTWGLKELDIPELWSKTKGEHINVAVLDTGVYGNHPALVDRLKGFIVIDPLGNRIETQSSFDSGEHGTHVCGTVVGGKTSDGLSIGVAPSANLYVAGVLVGNATLRTLFEGISWAVEKGADIISMSLGLPYYEPLFAEVFKMLTDQYGVLPVAAIGNENYGNSSSPGNAPGALSVGAVEKLPGGKVDVAFFSSGASLVLPGEGGNTVITKPDVVAPGVQVYSCIPPSKKPDGTHEYAYMDGTSMATPHAAGVAALLMAAKPTVPVTAIMEVMKDTAKHPERVRAEAGQPLGLGHPSPGRGAEGARLKQRAPVRRMSEAGKYAASDKIGSRFAEMLGRLGPDQKVRAIVLLRLPGSDRGSRRRVASGERRAAVGALRTESEPAVRDIDKILERFKGTRLATHADALGSVPVETTPAGISALATSEHVKAILEDQPISLLSFGR